MDIVSETASNTTLSLPEEEEESGRAKGLGRRRRRRKGVLLRDGACRPLMTLI